VRCQMSLIMSGRISDSMTGAMQQSPMRLAWPQCQRQSLHRQIRSQSVAHAELVTARKYRSSTTARYSQACAVHT
jgi:hypothetical protein